MKTIHHTSSTRSWAGKKYQNFLGTYREHSCGLFFDLSMEAGNKKAITQAFESCPKSLRKLASTCRLTVNMSVFNRTFENDCCTIYGTSPEYGDPHLEVGKCAMGNQLPPFLCHEACHLWWRRQCTREQKTKFIKALLAEMSKGNSLDVTDYANDYWIAFKDSVDGKITTVSLEEHDSGTMSILNRWAEESFCESTATLSFPAYKAEEGWKSSVNLKARRRLIESTLGLKFD